MEENAKSSAQTHKRVTTRLPVKLLVESVFEIKGVIISMSVTEMVVASRQSMKRDDQIIAYINGTERLEGRVFRTMGNVFIIKMELPKVKKLRVIEMLTTETAYRDGILQQRQITSKFQNLFRRKQKEKSNESACILKDGSSKSCSVVDISLTELSIKIDDDLPIGETVRVGKIRATVSQKTSDGYVLEIVSTTETEPELALSRKLDSSNTQKDQKDSHLAA